MIEHKIRTNEWWKRVSMTIFGMIVIDSLNFHQACMAQSDISDTQNDWIVGLAHELILNTVDERPSEAREKRKRSQQEVRIMETSPELTPTKMKNKSGYSLRRMCRVPGCEQKSSHVCRACTADNPDEEPYFVCHKKTGRLCWDTHIEMCHSIEPMVLED